MSLLRRTRTEMAGAWRSLRYDLGRTAARPPVAGPDVTSTGMGTFGIAGLVADADAEAAAPSRKPRRALAVTAFGVLTVAGAAGAYLGVVNGLGSLMAETTAVAGTLPPRAVVSTSAGMGPSAPAKRPRVAVVPRTAAARPATAVATSPVPVPVTTGVPPRAEVAAPAPSPSRMRPATAKAPVARTPAAPPTSPQSDGTPPVPTPTAPASSPSPTGSPSPSDSASPSPGESAEPDDSVAPRSRDGHRHRRRH
ncbi:hypothetical protein [Actinoplanes sp. URMC 104]|uniref:hypothetical protein n=1 Tax=Actinoplanes sp. URMC 104 TaxID=3423409 RepID=UPI003F1C18EA